MTEAQVGDKIRKKTGGAVEVLALCETPGRAWVISAKLFCGLVSFSGHTPYVVDLADYNLDEH